MSWTMLVACSFLSAILATDGQDLIVLTEKNASPYAYAQQAVESHFQLSKYSAKAQHTTTGARAPGVAPPTPLARAPVVVC